MVTVLKNQLVLEGHDKQFLLNRLSLFIKQQQEYQKRIQRQYFDQNSATNSQQSQGQLHLQPPPLHQKNSERSSFDHNRMSEIGDI